MVDITLSSAVRSNLLSLQSTADLLGQTQERLATGLKVNSALDDPNAFFTASSLNSRGSDLNRLLDSVGLSVQTIRAADEGIKSITTLVESAQATARQALQAPSPAPTAAVATGTNAIADDTAATATSTGALAGTALLNTLGAITDGDSITVQVGGTTRVIGFNNTGVAGAGQDAAIDLNGANDAVDNTDDATVDDLIALVNTQLGASATVTDGTGGQISIVAANAVDDIVITGSDAGVLSDLNLDSAGTGTATVRTIEPANATIGALAGDLTVQVGAGAVTTITFGDDDGASEVSTRAELTAALSGLAGGTLAINGSDFLTATAANATDSITIGGDGAILTALGLSAGAEAPGSTPNAQRTALENQFNSLRTQIDQLSADASFNGNNLLQGDNLTVIFNEDGSSSLSITGVTFNSAGLGIAAAAADDFQSDATINTTLGTLDTAISSLRTQASTFGSNLSVVEVRQDFTKALINTLETGAANLTLADTNLEGANLLALQTRQQLSSTALSLASQADQNVLRLIQ